MEEENTIEQKESPELETVRTKLLNSQNQKTLEEKENEKEIDIKDLNPSIPITLSRKIRWIIFSILIYFTLVMELDQGILSSSTDSISKDMELNSNELGLIKFSCTLLKESLSKE